MNYLWRDQIIRTSFQFKSHSYLEFTLCATILVESTKINFMSPVQISELQNWPCFVICFSADVDKSNHNACRALRVVLAKMKEQVAGAIQLVNNFPSKRQIWKMI